MKAVNVIIFYPDEAPELAPPNMAIFSNVVDVQDYHIDAVYEAAEYAREVLYANNSN